MNYHGMPVSHLLGLPSMENLKNFEWKKNNLKLENLVYLGIRALDQDEKDVIKELGIKYYTPYDVDALGGITKVFREIEEFLELGREETKLHLSFDVDSCSSSYLCGTGTAVDYGLSKRELIYVMQKVY